MATVDETIESESIEFREVMVPGEFEGENPEPPIDQLIREVHEIYTMVAHLRPIIMSITQEDAEKVAGNPMVKMLMGNLFKK